MDSYRTQLAKKINILHSESCSIKYWGLILDQFLFLIINQIYIEQKILKKIFLKNKNLIVNKELFTNTYLDSQKILLHQELMIIAKHFQDISSQKIWDLKPESLLEEKFTNLKLILKIHHT